MSTMNSGTEHVAPARGSDPGSSAEDEEGRTEQRPQLADLPPEAKQAQEIQGGLHHASEE